MLVLLFCCGFTEPTTWLWSESNKRSDAGWRASSGQEHLVESEQSERLYLVIRDSFRNQPKEKPSPLGDSFLLLIAPPSHEIPGDTV